MSQPTRLPSPRLDNSRQQDSRSQEDRVGETGNAGGLESLDRPRSTSPSEPSPTIPFSVAQFWKQHVNVVVDFEGCRDHLALERTFLDYVRTSLMLAVVGSVIAQLFTLQQKDSGFGYSLVGKPLAVLCYVCSICTVLLGAFRTWRHQHAIINGKALSGGIEISTLAVLFLALMIIFLGFLVAIDVAKESAKS